MHDLIIIGAGPAGVSAGVYAGRKKLKTLMFTESFGGQSVVSATIENWIGDVTMKGYELAQKLEKHVRAQETVEIVLKKVERVVEIDGGFEVEVSGEKYQAKSLLIASGGRHRHLEVPGEDKLSGKGVAYCSTCDAPFFRNKTVAVVGGGNSGLEACVDLFPYAEKIYLLNLTDQLKGDPITQEEVEKSDKVEIIHTANTKEILGETSVTGLKYEDTTSGEIKELEVQGVFVEIGMIPNSDFLGDLVELDDWRQIKVDLNTGATSREGVFAAGDITNRKFKQNNIAAGDAAAATLSVSEYLMKQGK